MHVRLICAIKFYLLTYLTITMVTSGRIYYEYEQPFYRAMLCIRGTSHDPVSVCPSVRLSVSPSQVGVLLKRLNVGSHKQHHTIIQGL